MDQPKITVITVALNAASELPLTIESVLSQTYPKIEYLVVDGGSCDATGSVLARYCSAIDRIVSLEDAGIFDAMNAAARLANGEFVLFLNAGDRFFCADAVAAMVERRQGDPDIFYGDHIYVEGRAETLVRSADFGWIRQRLLEGRVGHGWHRAMPCHQATFTRTELLRDLPYDTRYAICADHDFLLRACDAGARLFYVDEIVCHYFAGGLSANAGPVIHREWARAYRKHSMRPIEVDRLFFPITTQSPFPSRTTGSGLLLGGAHDEEPAPGNPAGRWRWAATTRFAAPELAETVGVELCGYGLHPQQRLTLSSGGKVLASATVGQGAFRLRLAFAEPVAPGQTIEISPDFVARLSAQDAREAGWGFESVDFLSCPWFAGDSFAIAASSSERASAALVEGWDAIAANAPYVRAAAGRGLVAVSSGELASELNIFCMGDPLTPSGQDVSVRVNGNFCGEFRTSSANGVVTYPVAVAGMWRKGANVVELLCKRATGTAIGGGREELALAGIGWRTCG